MRKGADIPVKLLTLSAMVLMTSMFAACSTMDGAMNSYVNTLRSVFIKSDNSNAGANLDPVYRYLRITIQGRVIFAVLAYIDEHPNGDIEVYYTGGREVIRIHNGRIVGAIGLLTEWRNVSQPNTPAWATIARTGQPVTWQRTRDVMPGYRYGVQDQLLLSVIQPVNKSALQDLDPQSLTWFEERHQTGPAMDSWKGFTTPGSTANSLPPARFAVDFTKDRETVVYSEQCLAQDLCFAFQRWLSKKP